MPAPIKLMVVDIYQGDKVASFAQAKASGIVGIIHKATEGATWVDPTYAARKSQAKAAGLLWGAYHFARNSDVEAQVYHFLRTADPDDDTLLCLDFEDAGSNTMSVAQARRFMQLVDQQSGRSCVLYSGNLIKETLGAKVDPFFGAHRLWLAQYGINPTAQASWSKPWLWQFSGDGIGPGPKKVPGIPGAADGSLDLNSYDGTPEQLAAEWSGRTALAPQAPIQKPVETKSAILPPPQAQKLPTGASGGASGGVLGFLALLQSGVPWWAALLAAAAIGAVAYFAIRHFKKG